MDLKQIKELMTAMEKSGIKKVSLKEKTGFELEIERQGEPSVSSFRAPVDPHHQALFIPHPMPKIHDFAQVQHQAQHVSEEPKVQKSVEGKFISSPMVGTYYSAPSPEHAAFVKVGDKVDEQTVVCIVEAMKVMNEVKAGVSGTIAEICLENGHPVEFGTKLFRVV